MKSFLSLIKLARPAQWSKNIFVFTALIFSGAIIKTDALKNSILAFIIFCLAASGIYFFNDFKDLKEDRLHKTKKNRPLASGELPPFTGILGSITLTILALFLSTYYLDNIFTLIIAFFVVMNIAYSMGLKHIAILDVFIISAGFVLRVLAGASAISKMPSAWLIICATTVSLFLGFTKRRAEIVAMGLQAVNHRKVLGKYNEAFLDQVISIVTTATVVCYALYTVDPYTIEMVGSKLLILSLPLVLYGIFRYLYLVYHSHSGSDPTKNIFSDIPLLITGTLWVLLCLAIVLFGNSILK
jgi:4-hydroxybenzoate polyprenyltransferase